MFEKEIYCFLCKKTIKKLDDIVISEIKNSKAFREYYTNKRDNFYHFICFKNYFYEG